MVRTWKAPFNGRMYGYRAEKGVGRRKGGTKAGRMEGCKGRTMIATGEEQ